MTEKVCTVSVNNGVGEVLLMTTRWGKEFRNMLSNGRDYRTLNGYWRKI